MPADWEAAGQGMGLNKELQEGVPEVQRMLVHSIIEFAGMTEAQLQARIQRSKQELDEMRETNPWVAALEEQQDKLTASRKQVAAVLALRIGVIVDWHSSVYVSKCIWLVSFSAFSL